MILTSLCVCVCVCVCVRACVSLSFLVLTPRRWGRWGDILSHGRFKRPLREADVETICRALLAYCLLHYRGDENIKGFIWDLIAPTEDGSTKMLANHSGT